MKHRCVTAIAVVLCLSLVACSDDGPITDTEPGEEVWSNKASQGIDRASPTVVDGLVFQVVSGGRLLALETSTGEVAWEHDVTSAGSDVSVNVVGDRLYYARQTDFPNIDMVVGLDSTTGDVEWGVDEAPPRMAPTIYGDTAFVSGEAAVEAFDIDDGSTRWEYDNFEEGFHSPTSPTIVDGTVVVGGGLNSNVTAIDADSGDEQWRFDTGDAVHAAVTVADGVVYAGSHDETLYALDLDSGDELWSFTEPSDVIGTTGRASSSGATPTVSDGVVYVGSYDETLYAVDATSGDERWRYTEPDSAISQGATVADGVVFAVEMDSVLHAIDAETGDQLWTSDLGGAASFSSPIVVDGIVYATHANGVVHAIDAGVSGSSDDSRVNLGTTNHHHEWAERAAQ